MNERGRLTRVREREKGKKERVRGREREKKEGRNETVIYAEKEIVSFNLIER